MPHRIRSKAEVSVARGCAFAGLGIGTCMIGMIAEPAQSLVVGGVLTLMASFVLMLKANLAPARSYKRTELWLMLDQSERPQATIAQQVIGTALRDVYLRFALYAAHLSAGLLAVSLLFRLAGAKA